MHTHANDIRTISAHHIDRHVYSIYDSIEWDLFISSRAIFLFCYFFFRCCCWLRLSTDVQQFALDKLVNSVFVFNRKLSATRKIQKAQTNISHIWADGDATRMKKASEYVFEQQQLCTIGTSFFFVRLLELASSLLVKWTNDMIVAHYHKWRIMVLEG